MTSVFASWGILLRPILFTAVVFGHTSTCPHRYEPIEYDSKFTDCYYIRRLANFSWNRSSSEIECSNLDAPRQSWRLPKLNDDDKMNDLFEIVNKSMMFNSTTKWIFWLDLIRDNVTNENESSRIDLWRDWSKWRWSGDEHFNQTGRFESTPWRTSQPDNVYYKKTPRLSERCVVATVDRRQRPLGSWDDWPCEFDLSQFGNSKDNDFLLICELTLDKTATPPKSSTEGEKLKEKSGDASDKKAFDWQWILLGVCGVCGVACAVVIAAIVVRRRRRTKMREKLEAKKAQQPDSANTSQMSTYQKVVPNTFDSTTSTADSKSLSGPLPMKSTTMIPTPANKSEPKPLTSVTMRTANSNSLEAAVSSETLKGKKRKLKKIPSPPTQNKAGYINMVPLELMIKKTKSKPVPAKKPLFKKKKKQ